MIISGIIKNSFIDYPGLISCVLFVPFCNYDCFYCHNRSLLSASHPVVMDKYIEDFLKSRVNLIDAVVISGGEPTLQKGLVPYINKIRELGYKIKLDTNGSSPETVSFLLQKGICDYFAVDLKAPASRYKEICGEAADAEQVFKTIDILLNSNAKFEVRTTVIPQLDKADLIEMSKEIPVVPRYSLNIYRPPEKYKQCDETKILEKPYSKEQINTFIKEMSVYQPNMIPLN